MLLELFLIWRASTTFFHHQEQQLLLYTTTIQGWRCILTDDDCFFSTLVSSFLLLLLRQHVGISSMMTIQRTFFPHLIANDEILSRSGFSIRGEACYLPVLLSEKSFQSFASACYHLSWSTANMQKFSADSSVNKPSLITRLDLVCYTHPRTSICLSVWLIDPMTYTYSSSVVVVAWSLDCVIHMSSTTNIVLSKHQATHQRLVIHILFLSSLSCYHDETRTTFAVSSRALTN